MAKVRLRRAAEESLIELYLFSAGAFGQRHADSYIEKMVRIFDLIAEQPAMGQACEHLLPGCRRHVWQAHVIYYSIEGPGIRIIDILGAGEDPARKLESGGVE